MVIETPGMENTKSVPPRVRVSSSLAVDLNEVIVGFIGAK